MDELCQEVGFKYDVLTADIDEKAIRREDPSELVTLLARAKADAIQGRMEDKEKSKEENALLITCDQVVVHQGSILEKPVDEQEARKFIGGYAHAPASTVGAIAVTQVSSGKVELDVDTATVYFNPIPKETTDALIEEGEVFYAAGGLLVEHDLVQPHVVKIDGTMDSIMGLPKSLVLSLLSKFFD